MNHNDRCDFLTSWHTAAGLGFHSVCSQWLWTLKSDHRISEHTTNSTTCTCTFYAMWLILKVLRSNTQLWLFTLPFLSCPVWAPGWVLRTGHWSVLLQGQGVRSTALIPVWNSLTYSMLKCGSIDCLWTGEIPTPLLLHSVSTPAPRNWPPSSMTLDTDRYEVVCNSGFELSSIKRCGLWPIVTNLYSSTVS